MAIRMEIKFLNLKKKEVLLNYNNFLLFKHLFPHLKKYCINLMAT